MRIRSLGIALVLCVMVAVYITSHETLSASVGEMVLTATPTKMHYDFISRMRLFYKVAFLPDEAEALDIYNTPGESSEITGKLRAGIIIEYTGETEIVDDVIWVLVRFEDQEGWLPRHYLAANLEPELFCEDPRVPELLTALQEAMQDQDTEALVSLVAPRGLYMSWNGGATLFLTPDEISQFFEDDVPRNWGNNGYGGEDFIGSLSDDIIPALRSDLLNDKVIITCNDNQDNLSITNVLYALYIDDYDITNFYAVMRPGAPGFEHDWSAWGMAVEYWQNEPKILGLANYGWTP